jgi:pilus assembly protein CpaB
MARKKLLLAAAIVGLFAGFLIFLYGKQIEQERDAVTANPHDVIIASQPIPAGTALTEDLIATRSVPEQFLPANPLLATELHIYLGQPVSGDIAPETMLLTSDFSVREVSRTLAGRIPVGERALTLPVDAVSGIAGLLRPGDRVDIMSTFPVSTEDHLIPEAMGGDSMGYVTMSLLQNVTLLAVGQEISEVGSARHQHQRGGYANVTISVTPDEVELLIIAQTRGRLQLALRHREDLNTVTVRPRHLREELERLDLVNERRRAREETRQPSRVTTCPRDHVLIDGNCELVILR